MFGVHALSYQIGAMKPDPRSYTAAAQLAGVNPQGIFFTDDREDNVTAAAAAGWDAVQYTSVSQLNEALCSRGIVTNY